jgi:transposase-like protein
MARREQFSMTLAERRKRTFSESFKRDKVREIELGLLRISEVCKQYSVSHTAVYQWFRKFGIQRQTSERTIIETMSDTRALIEMKARLAELERIVGQKQIEIDFYKKMIDLAQEHYGIEIKKNYSTQLCGSSGSTGNKTDTA